MAVLSQVHGIKFCTQVALLSPCSRMMAIYCLIVGASFLISIKFWNKVTFLVLSHYVTASFVRLWNSFHHTKVR